MKYWIIFFLLLSMGITGCEDVLDVTPENSLTFRNGIETEKDLGAALDATALYMRTAAGTNFYEQTTKGSYADKGSEETPYRLLSPEWIIEGYWNCYYLVISQANIVLHFADQVKMDDKRRKLYTGQAYFYKALVYFELVRRYGDCVLVKDEVDINPQAKSSWTEVADYAINMAQKAVDNLVEFDKMTDYNGNSPRYKSMPSKGAANALLAHLCAWKAGGKYFASDKNYNEQELWKRAKEACDSVILSGIYELAGSPEEVCAEVLRGGSKESIYETVYKDFFNELSVPDELFCLARFYQSYPVFPNSVPSDIQEMPFRVYSSKMLEMFPGDDLRRQAYFYKFDTYANPDSVRVTGGFAYPYKWREVYVNTNAENAGEFINYYANLVWWRLADIYLLRAECKVRLGDDAGAIRDLDAVRDRAHAMRYSSSEYEGDLRYAIFKEREKELLFEGYRYYDIIRNGYARTELEGGFCTATDQDFTDGAFFLALPYGTQEFKNNPLMRQNKYWFKFM